MEHQATAWGQGYPLRGDPETGENIPQGGGYVVVDDGIRDHIRSIGGPDVERVAVLSFRALQLYRIAAHQNELVTAQTNAMLGHKMKPDYIDSLLQKYADSIRNYETLSQDIVSSKVNSFEFLGEGTPLQVVKRRGDDLKIWSKPSLTVQAHQLSEIGPLGFRELDKRRRLARERSSAYALRLRMSMFGGMALLVPMLIMALHPGLITDLVTTSVATVMFAIIIVWVGTDSSGKDVLAITTAYTAVLVVFVGASLAPSSSTR